MNFRNLSLAIAASVAICAPSVVAKELTADALTKSLMQEAEFVDIAISPDGSKLAIARRIGESVGVTVHQRADMKPLITFDSGAHGIVSHLQWLDDARLLVGATRTSTMNGFALSDPVMVIATLDGQLPTTMPWDFWSTIEGDSQHLLVSSCGFGPGNNGCNQQQVRRHEVGKTSGKGEVLIEGPPDARMTLNAAANAGFAMKWEEDDTSRTYVYKPADKTWTLINDGSATGVEVFPMAVTKDGKTGYLQTERKDGPDLVEKYDFTTGQRTTVYADAHSDPMGTIYSLDGNDVIGAFYEPTDPKPHFWSPEHPDAVLLSQLQGAFPGQLVWVIDHSKDNNLLVLGVSGDRDPGTWYLFDRQARKATPIARQYPWLETRAQASQRSIEVTARDGTLLHGLLTLPPGSAGKNLPLVVHPHGGPYWIFDKKGYDTEGQILAQHGYAVLQLNFRGSGGYGRPFHEAGTKQWGRAMQDDLTDATKWVIGQGIADPNRVCIYGVSYGAYAALMGPIHDPGLYKCVAAYAGPSDLAKMTRWDSQHRDNLSKKWFAKMLGEGKDLAPVSPALNADKFKVPALIAHGYRDARVGVRHAQAMRDALRENGVAVDYIEYSDTGHYLMLDQHREDFYARLLRLLDANIGPGSRPAGQATASQ